jgi:hypothetical protein
MIDVRCSHGDSLNCEVTRGRVSDQRGDLTGSRVQCEMAGVEDRNFGVCHIFATAFPVRPGSNDKSLCAQITGSRGRLSRIQLCRVR